MCVEKKKKNIFIMLIKRNAFEVFWNRKKYDGKIKKKYQTLQVLRTVWF